MSIAEAYQPGVLNSLRCAERNICRRTRAYVSPRSLPTTVNERTQTLPRHRVPPADQLATPNVTYARNETVAPIMNNEASSQPQAALYR
jgi:hypothetical protein